MPPILHVFATRLGQNQTCVDTNRGYMFALIVVGMLAIKLHIYYEITVLYPICHPCLESCQVHLQVLLINLCESVQWMFTEYLLLIFIAQEGDSIRDAVQQVYRQLRLALL